MNKSPRTVWTMIGIELYQRNPDNRYPSYAVFEDTMRLEGVDEEDVLRQAADIDAKTDKNARSPYGEGRAYLWMGPYLMVATDLTGDPNDDDNYYVDASRDLIDYVGSRVLAVPSYAAARQAEEEKIKREADAIKRKAEKARVTAEKAQYERLKKKFGDNA